jgi:NitT/TauT family transport system substrate-binding protein
MSFIGNLRYALLVCLLFLLPTSLLAQEDGALQEETLLMTFIPNVQFSPMYLAIADGYFAEAGFDVSLEYLNEPDVLDLVAADQEQFGVVSGEQVILATAQGRDVIYVYEWFQRYPIGVVVRAESDVTEPVDLDGLRIGVPGRFGATYSGITTLLNFADLSEANITLEEIGFAAPEVFCLGVLDASTIYINNEPLQIRNRALQGDCGDISDVRVVEVADYVDLVSNGIITNRRMLDENPEAVRAFVGAYDAGLATVINNPAHAYLQSEAFVEGLPLSDEMRTLLETMADEQTQFLATEPDRQAIADSRQSMLETLRAELPLDEITQFEVLLASIDLWDAEQLGFTDGESWVNMQTTLQALGALDTEVDLEAHFTNEFLSESE